MAEIVVEVLDRSDRQTWVDFISNVSSTSVFQTPEWLEGAGHPVRIYACYENGNLVGGIALSHRTLLGNLSFAVPPPITPRIAPLLRPLEAGYTKKLSREKRVVGALAQRLKEDYLSVHLLLPQSQLDIQPYLNLGYRSRVRYTYILPLGDTDRLWESLDSSRRRNIRAAKRDGLSVECSSDARPLIQLGETALPEIWCRSGFRQMVLRHDKQLAQQDARRVFTVTDESGEPVASAYIVWDKTTAYYLLGAQLKTSGFHGAATYALWEAIRYSSEELSLKSFDMEGSMIPHIERYFRKFGGVLTPSFRVWSQPRWMDSALSVRRKAMKLTGWGRKTLRSIAHR